MAVRQRGSSKPEAKGSQSSKESSEQSNGQKSGPFSGRFNPRFQPPRKGTNEKDSFMSHKAWAKGVLAIGLFVVVYFTNANKEKSTIMAKKDEILDKKRQQSFLCAPSYKREIDEMGNKGCIPAKCGRAVVDQLFSVEESHRLLSIAKKAFVKAGSNGGASILDLHSGALSKGDEFVNVFISYPDLFTEKDFEAYRDAKEKVREFISENFGVTGLYLTHPTFFSKLDAKAPKTIHDEYWHIHVDKETYPNFHYTSLLYLTDYGTDFQGGQFVFVDTHDKLNRTIEPREGRVSVFTSGVENKHYVTPVTSGTRYALTMGFTCDASKSIADPGSKQHMRNHKIEL